MALILEIDSCKYTYTQPELVDLARKIGHAGQKLLELDDQLATFKSQHNAKVKAAEEESSLHIQRLNSGYEMRQTELMILKFRPDADSALVIRLDTGRVHDKRKLKDDEKQLKLTTKQPEHFIFTADFYWQEEGDVATMCAEGVPLTKLESDKVREFTTLKPMRKMLAAKAGK